MTRDEIQNKINQNMNVLGQRDYSARIVAFETARLLKQLHPELEMPALGKYLVNEAAAEVCRAEIRQLREQLENAEE